MATPHVSGVAALMKAEDPTLTTAQVRTILQNTGELPDGSASASGCASSSQWSGDSDGIAEPLVNALRAAQVAADATSFDPPDVDPVAGQRRERERRRAAVSGGLPRERDRERRVLHRWRSIGSDTTEPFSASWDTALVVDGSHSARARATAGERQQELRL